MIYKGDDTNSFNQNWLIINAVYPSDWEVASAELKIGDLPAITIDEPDFPLPVNLTASQTSRLKDINTCTLTLIDPNGLRQTCEGTYTFSAKKRG